MLIVIHLYPFEKTGSRAFQTRRNSQYISETQVSLTALDAADVGAMKPNLFGEFFLRNPHCFPSHSHVGTKLFQFSHFDLPGLKLVAFDENATYRSTDSQ